MTEASSFLMAMPELVLTAAGLILLMVAAYAGVRATHAVSWLSVLALGAAGITLLLPTTHGTAFDGLYQADAFAAFAKLLIYIAAAICIVIAPRFFAVGGIPRAEYPLLIIFASVGMGMRSEERRVGKGGVSTCGSRWSPFH